MGVAVVVAGAACPTWTVGGLRKMGVASSLPRAEGGEASGGEAAAETGHDGEAEELAEAHDHGDGRGHGHVVVLERLLVGGGGDGSRLSRPPTDERGRGE